jgi:pyrroline-5-carboxylate reductase
MNATSYRIGFFGFGHMAQVIFEAIDRARLVPRSHVQFLRRDRSKMKENEQKFKITATSLEHLVETSDLIFLCFRPQQAPEALAQLAEIGGLEGKWIVSILAGVTISTLQKGLKRQGQILRVLPNLPSAVNEGMSVLSFGPNCSSEFTSFAKILFGSMGEVAEIEERHMDIACGVSGSGPGFVFRLIETMARTGEKHGLPYPVALKMAAQTFLGAAKLISKGHMPQDLMDQITTPNGTTFAGFERMNQTEIDRHFQSVIEATARRSKELS